MLPPALACSKTGFLTASLVLFDADVAADAVETVVAFAVSGYDPLIAERPGERAAQFAADGVERCGEPRARRR